MSNDQAVPNVAPSSISESDAIRALADQLICRDDQLHYCPNHDGLIDRDGRIRDALIAYADLVRNGPAASSNRSADPTLRDYFAAKAMQGAAASAGYQGLPWDQVARHSYEAADAMLKAREQ